MRLQRCSRGGLASGFTLIELLVVVFLIGLVSSFAVLNINSQGDNREIFEELQKFRHQLTLAGSEAVIQGRPIGVQLDEKRYQFLLAGQTEWQELNDIEALQPQKLPPEWKIEPLLGSREVSFQEADIKSNGQQNDKTEAKLIPHIIFFSSGEMDPFELLIVNLDDIPKYRIWYGEEGAIMLESMDEK